MNIIYQEYKDCKYVGIYREGAIYLNHYALKIIDKNLEVHCVLIDSSKLLEFFTGLKLGTMQEISLCYGRSDIDIKVDNGLLVVIENENDLNVKEFYLDLNVLDVLIKDLSKK